MSLTMAELIPGERSAFFESVRVVGLREDFLVSVRPEFDGAEERDYTMQGKLTVMPKFQWTRHDTHSVTFTIAEA